MVRVPWCPGSGLFFLAAPQSCLGVAWLLSGYLQCPGSGLYFLATPWSRSGVGWLLSGYLWCPGSGVFSLAAPGSCSGVVWLLSGHHRCSGFGLRSLEPLRSRWFLSGYRRCSGCGLGSSAAPQSRSGADGPQSECLRVLAVALAPQRLHGAARVLFASGQDSTSALISASAPRSHSGVHWLLSGYCLCFGCGLGSSAARELSAPVSIPPSLGCGLGSSVAP